MNVNENVPVFGRGRGRGRQLKVVPIQRTLMGPPIRPAPKRKESSTSANQTTSSSSNINWRQNQKNTQNNSTTVRTSSSSRSHSSTEPESRVVIALSEGRGEAVGEVGIAAINIARPSLILCQISDSQSYINTLTKINILNPSEILVPLTFIESFTSNRLIEKVKEQFHDIKITGVSRSSFNKTTGLHYVKQLCVQSMNSIVLILQHRYYALAAAAALLTYTETTLFVVYARESINIEYQESEGSTIIDVATADRLELVASARPTIKKRFSCLLDVLNHCLTKIGGRTLRASILQPPCSVPDIEARLDCVTELVEHSEMLAAIQVTLLKLTNIDQLLTLATVLPDQAQSCSERQINYILLLNTVLEQITPLQDIFENSKQPFFIELRATLRNPVFAEIKDLVRTVIHTDAHPGKGQYGMFQRCFAIKSGINSLLDLVRKSYSERLDDMRKYVTTLGERYSLALTLHNNQKKGYHILLNLNAHQKKTLKKNDLPPECIQVERLSNSYTMKTQDLINLSNRVEDIMSEILKISNIMIHKLLIQIRKNIGMFYKLCEDIAKLDMFQSLAKASSAVQYVRPQFAEYLEVTQARHPLLDYLCSTEPSANSMYASKEYNINIITGPNGSGKSIFVRQVILIQVMAQVGCYVPAQSATLRVIDRILARVYLEDNMDCGASAFVLEMKEIQYFLTVLTNNTLIIIDELCRSTSVEEGTALAMAVCEKLMKTSAFVFFTTHFKVLTKLQDLHFCVKTWQLETLTQTIDDQMVLHFTYNVIPGITALEHYGIFLAKGSWPENIIKYAEDILRKLSRSQKRPSPQIEQVNAAARLKYDLEAELQMLKAKKDFTCTKINAKLMEYERNLQDLGHQVEILCISDQVNDGNQFSVYGNDNNNHNIVSVGNQSDNQCYSGNLIQANSDYPLNQLIESFDYFNLPKQSQYSNIDISQNVNQLVVNPQIHYSPTMQNRNIFENLHGENEETPRLFDFQNSIQQMENFNQENPNSFYQENLRFPPPTQLFPDHINRKMYFQNNNECQGTATALQDYYESFSDYPNDLNNSAISEKIAHLESAGVNESLNFSYSNIFEPEVILEFSGELELNNSKIQNQPAQQKSFVFQKESTAVHQKTTFVTQENIFMTSLHRNLPFPQEYSYISTENSVLPQKGFIISRESFIVSRENSIISERDLILSKENSIYEDAISECCDIDNGFIKNIGSDDYVEQPMNVNESERNDESFMSITEQQFSLPLQQHVERTSTPINFTVNSHSQPLPVRNPTDMNLSNPLVPKSNKGNKFNFEESVLKTSKVAQQSKINSSSFNNVNWCTADQINTTCGVFATPTNITKPKINEQQSKSGSTKSDSIKWVAPNQNNTFATPTIFRTPKSTSSNGTKLSINPQMPKNFECTRNANNKKISTSSSNANSKTTSTDSIIWNMEKKMVQNTNNMQKSVHNVSDSHCYSEADITEVLNDLQSCSEYFSESQDWDFVDEEVNSKLINALDKTSQIRRPIDGTKNKTEKELTHHSEYQCRFQENFQSQEKEKKSHQVRSHDVDLIVSSPNLQNNKDQNQLKSTTNVEPNGPQCGKQKNALMQREEKAPYSIDTKNVYLKGHKRVPKAKNVRKVIKQCTKKVKKSQLHKVYHHTKTQYQEDDKKTLPEKIPSLLKPKTQCDEGLNVQSTKFQGDEKSHQEESNKEATTQKNKNVYQLHCTKNVFHSKYEKEQDFSSDFLQSKHDKDISQEHENILTHNYGKDQDASMKQKEVSQSQNKTKKCAPYNKETCTAYCSETNKEAQFPKIGHLLCKISQVLPNKETFHVNDETHQQQWNEENFHKQHEERPHLQVDEEKNIETHESRFDASISECGKIPFERGNHEGTQHSEGIHQMPYHQGIHYSQGDKITAQSKSIPKHLQPQYEKEIYKSLLDFEIHEFQCHEATHQLKHNQGTSQQQSFSEIYQLKDNEELHQSPQLKLIAKIDQFKCDETSQSQCSKETRYFKEISQLQHAPGIFELNKHVQSPNDQKVIPSGQTKSMEYLENAENENKDTDITFLSSGNKNIPDFEHSKQNNHSCKQSQDEQMEIKGNDHNTETDQKWDVGCVQSQNSSLEPLGDIHLELFSFKSIFDESLNQINEEDSLLNKPSSNQYGDSIPTKKILPADDGSSKIALDCSNAIPEQSKLSLICQKNVNTTTDEYETAHSVLVSSQQDSIFFNTCCSFEQASASTPDDKKRQQPELSQTEATLSQKPKRRRLDNPQYSSPVPAIANRPIFNKETSPDIFEESQQEIYPLYKDESGEMSQTPSDFESSKNTKSSYPVKKSKWISPLKTSSKNSDAFNEQKKVLQRNLLRKPKTPKFKPPKKLTKKEIELDFYEQDKRMLESGDSSQYQQIINRPSVRQLQQAKYIASIHKTSSGVVVVPAKECKPKIQKRKFITPLKRKLEDFDVTLFSDKNSDKFEQFMNNNNSKKIINTRQDIANQFIESEVVRKNDNKENVNTEENSSGKVCKDVQNYKVKILQNIQLASPSNIVKKREIFKHPKEGYYTQNKKRIDNIVDKYLKPEIETTCTANVAITSSSQKQNSQEFNLSIFSQSTVVLDIADD